MASTSRPSLVLAALVLATGCLKSAAYVCTSDSDCEHAGVAGTCEAVGACSFPDPVCTSGRRYGGLSGDHADRCVEGGDGAPDASHVVDAGIDARPLDAAPPDAPGCPSGYATILGGGAHLYRRLAAAAPWANQRAACRAEGTNIQLAVPDDAAELHGLSALAVVDPWIGVGDAQLEGTYVTVYNVPATYLPWAPGEPDNSGNQDCVRAIVATQKLETVQCSEQAIAVCECVP